MTSTDALQFIFSNPEWKSHFVNTHRTLQISSNCGCLDTSRRSFDNVNRIVTCKKCGKIVKDWYPSFDNGEQKSIADVILGEEEKFFQLLEEKEPIVISLKNDLTGENLSWLHQTHGIDPDMIEDILCIRLTKEQRDEYHKYYDIHRRTGLKGFKPQIITAS